MLNYCIFCFSQDFDAFYSATENYGRTNTCITTNSLVRILKKRIEDFNITTTNTNSEDEGINLVAYSNFSFIKPRKGKYYMRPMQYEPLLGYPTIPHKSYKTEKLSQKRPQNPPRNVSLA